MLAASGLPAIIDTTTDLTGGPGDVVTSNDGATAPTKIILRTWTSEKNPIKKATRQAKKRRKPDLTIKIPKEKDEDERIKQ